ncbi:NADH dehydrogenase (ubiquinone) B18 subunit [Megalopta genalis]|uniref:NADH dehydrogenase (ubiquinone) B18 subunit n=1 Tax=Megalopta genalis TaxID=115081 RepID=UPI003FD08890
MGSSFIRPLLRNWNDFPEADFTPSVDPLYGFENGRKIREPTATIEEMRAARVPKRYRNYCAHKFIARTTCLRKNYPFYPKCRKETDEYQTCVRDDIIIRMKEMERERRFRLRQKKMDRALKEATVAA